MKAEKFEMDFYKDDVDLNFIMQDCFNSKKELECLTSQFCSDEEREKINEIYLSILQNCDKKLKTFEDEYNKYDLVLFDENRICLIYNELEDNHFIIFEKGISSTFNFY